MRPARFPWFCALVLSACARTRSPQPAASDAGLPSTAEDASTDAAHDAGSRDAKDASFVWPDHERDAQPEGSRDAGHPVANQDAGDVDVVRSDWSYWPAPKLELSFYGAQFELEVIDTNQVLHPYILGQDFQYELWARIVNRSSEPQRVAGWGGHAFDANEQESAVDVVAQTYSSLCVQPDGELFSCVLPGETFVLYMSFVLAAEPSHEDISLLKAQLYIPDMPLPAETARVPFTVELSEQRDDSGYWQVQGSVRNDSMSLLGSPWADIFPQDASGRIVGQYEYSSLLLDPGKPAEVDKRERVGPKAHSMLWFIRD